MVVMINLFPHSITISVVWVIKSWIVKRKWDRLQSFAIKQVGWGELTGLLIVGMSREGDVVYVSSKRNFPNDCTTLHKHQTYLRTFSGAVSDHSLSPLLMALTGHAVPLPWKQDGRCTMYCTRIHGDIRSPWQVCPPHSNQPQ